MPLLGPNGQPITSDHSRARSKPLLGDVYAPWGGEQSRLPRTRFPLENRLQFDTNKLTLNDFRMMRDHYQVNSSLSVLTFMLHQTEWKVECDSIKIAKHCEDNLSRIWTRLVRALSHAFVFGFSPNAIQWENDKGNGKLIISKIKDLPPEECRVHWKSVAAASPRADGRSNPKVSIFDGIDQAGPSGVATINKENALWYPLLMEHGNHYGTRLLKSAYQPWFFSNLIHLYANRYFERYGEPTIVSRAPFDEKINVGTGEIPGNVLMSGLNNMVRSGAAVVLPNDRAQNGLDGVGNYEYTMEYLESQMRGADFERYLTRLDEEISLALFTPLLLLRTSDGGSFNLGVTHSQMYMFMLNAITADWAEYIDKYILAPMARYNFGDGAKLPRIRFRKLGKVQQETLRTIVNAAMSSGSVKADISDLAMEVGMTLEEVDVVTAPLTPPGQPNKVPGLGDVAKDPNADQSSEDGVKLKPKPKVKDKAGKPKKDNRTGRPEREKRAKGIDKGLGLAHAMADRAAGQVIKALREDAALNLDLGYSRQLDEILDDPDAFSGLANAWIAEYHAVLVDADPQESEIRQVLRDGLAGQMNEAVDDVDDEADEDE